MGKAAPVSNTSITALSPQIFVEIFQLLPLNQLAKVARLSRRFKVLSQQDAIYERHLGKLKMAGVLLVPKPDPLLNARDSLVARLCSLPEGQYLNLATGQAPSDLMTHSPIHDDAALNIPAASALASPSPVTSLPVTPSPTISIQEEEENQKIIAAYPDLKLSQLIIGSGGLKAALAQQKAKRKPSVANAPRISATSSNLIRIIPRDAFRQVYMELKPYYLDFECRQTESKVFKDFKDISKISAVLNKLQLLEKSGLLGTPNEDISFALQTAYEWFESTLLGHFEIAYDANNVYEMKRNAISAYYLNGGAAAVQLFISKNPVFFDESFNPSLIASKLPAVTGTSMGYALSDEFAKYMDHMLNNCKKQLEIVSHVFIPEMQAMTLFVNKVFEDSISEYLSSIIAAAKKREDLIVYLHTVASSIYTCFQFVDYLAQNNMNVSIDVEPVKDSIRDIFSAYFTSYIDDELKYLRKRYKSEIDKWDNRGAKSSKANAAAARESYLGDSKKAQEHKRYVMNTMKAIMFAPVALTSMVIEGVSGGKKPHQKSLLEDAEPITSDQFSPIRDNATYNLDDTSMNALLSLELVLNLMHTNKESLGRALVISSSLDISKL